MKKTLLICLLLSSILIANLTSCSSVQNEAEQSTEEAATQNETESKDIQETEPIVFDTGLEAVDYDGDEIHFLVRQHDPGNTRWVSRELGVNEITGDILNDAIYERNLFLIEKYNIDLTWEFLNTGELNNMVQKIVTAGENYVDCFMTSLGYTATMASNGYLYDLSELDNFNFDAPWWDKTLNDTLTIMNRRYLACGDMNIMTNDGVSAVLFNKKYIRDYHMDDPYGLVDNGSWTIDKYTEMSVNFNTDLDNNGIMDEHDLWGSVSLQDTTFQLLVSCGGYAGYKDENGVPMYHDLDEQYLNILNKIAACSNVGKTFNAHHPEFNAGNPTTSPKSFEVFGNGRGLFFTEMVGATNMLRDYNIDFGIIPFPKYDESQEEYISCINWYASTGVAIPVSLDTPNQISGILEDMACKSTELVNPAYYDITLDIKLARDETSIRMLDIIFSNRVLDIGIYNNFGDVITTGIFIPIKTGTNNFASSFESISSKAHEAATQLAENFKNQK